MCACTSFPLQPEYGDTTGRVRPGRPPHSVSQAFQMLVDRLQRRGMHQIITTRHAPKWRVATPPRHTVDLQKMDKDSACALLLCGCKPGVLTDWQAEQTVERVCERNALLLNIVGSFLANQPEGVTPQVSNDHQEVV